MNLRNCAWCIIGAIGACAALPLVARTRLNVSDVVGLITSALAVDRNDQRIAHSIESFQLTERLTPDVTELLVELGTGPATAHVLKTFEARSARLPLPSQSPLSATPVPSQSEQRDMINSARAFANDYLANLPNFVATREVHTYTNGKVVPLHDRWKLEAKYTTQAAYYAASVQPGAAAVKSGKRPAMAPISDGEFGGMMAAVFEPTSAATFKWDRWQVVDGTRTAVFSYQALRVFSKFTIENLPIGHHGAVFIEPQSGKVRRLVLYATGLTETSPISAAGDVLDYGQVSIGTGRYVLPVRSIAYIRTAQFESRDVIEYRDFHKFNAESAIDFGSGANEDTPKN